VGKKQRAQVVKLPGAYNSEGSNQDAGVDVGMVQRRAYEIYESRGCVDGAALDDWLQAERELRHDDRHASSAS
jgi:hypothetical protein